MNQPNLPKPDRKRFQFSTSVKDEHGNVTTAESIPPQIQKNGKIALPEIPEREYTKSDDQSGWTELDGLPSHSMFYPWTRASVRRMTVSDVRKAYRASATKSQRDLAQVIHACLDRDVMSMTSGDYWYTMYFHQSNSYPKAPITIKYTCTDEGHVKRVAEGELERSTLDVSTSFGKSDLRVVEIDDDRGRAIQRLLIDTHEKFGIYLYPYTVATMIEMVEGNEARLEKNLSEMMELNERVQADPDDMMASYRLGRKRKEVQDAEWIYEMAGYLHPQHGESLAERVAFLEQMEDLDIFDAIEEFKKLSEHGVIEIVTVTCPHCQARKEVTARMDAVNFLPAVQRAKFARNGNAG